MDILGFALQFELDGEKFYRESAAKAGDKNIANILLLLAKEEQKHYRMIKDLRDGLDKRPASMFISEINNIFTEMTRKNVTFVEQNDTITRIFEKALDIEQQSITYYEKKAGEIDNPKAKELLLILKKQEEAHYSLISSMIEYYERPQLWLENAEFSHLDDY
jgi:rubrerythrin